MNSLLKPVAALTLLVPVLCLGAEAAVPETSPGPDLSFRVERGGDPIGTHRISFTREGDELHVAIDIELAVSFGPITVFRYEHRNRETWRGGKLVALETETNDDGKRYTVSATASDKGLEVTSSANGTFMAPAGIIPTSYWNPATLAQTQLLDTQKGRIIDVDIEETGAREARADGRTIPVREYRMTGDLKLRLWYSPDMEWLNVIFTARGEEVDYHVERIDRTRLQRVAQQ
ncbi:MAG: DUF6134 family protein [Parvibaculum sp.]|uniref:DUF6134 family protein n=1 Tax=Parvibaculum sp. TaxID=2024848 RepID=UPI00326646AF